MPQKFQDRLGLLIRPERLGKRLEFAQFVIASLVKVTLDAYVAIVDSFFSNEDREEMRQALVAAGAIGVVLWPA